MSQAQEIHLINQKLDTLSSNVLNLTKSIGDIKVIKNQQDNDKELITKLTDQFEKWSDVLTQISNNLSAKDGERRGVSTAMKIVWTVFGSLIMATIIGASIMIMNHEKTIYILEHRVKTLEKKLDKKQGVIKNEP